MSKLPEENKFLDLSDYGRPVAKTIAHFLKNTRITPIHVTLWFVVAGIGALCFIYKEQYLLATLSLVIKSILDAADGELARIKKTPSYVGRYLDSVSDILLNLSLVLLIGLTNKDHLLVIFFAFVALQLQGTLYNYYYVILRNIYQGDTTSRIIENTPPIAFPSEKQAHVNVLFAMYKLCYGVFDYLIYKLDASAKDARNFPNWFMTVVSLYGLGFQLLMIGVLLVLGLKSVLLPIVIGYSIGIPILIMVRKFGLK
jgi:phosphatidylglycerophosphate synthase